MTCIGIKPSLKGTKQPGRGGGIPRAGGERQGPADRAIQVSDADGDFQTFPMKF